MVDPMALTSGAGMLSRQLQVGHDRGSPTSSKSSSRPSSKSPHRRRRQRRPTELQLSAASRVIQFLPLLAKKSTKPKEPKRNAAYERWEAKRTAEAAVNRSLMLTTLNDVSSVRRRVIEDKATKHEVTETLNKATRVVIDSTRRIIRMYTELDSIEDTLGNINYEMHCAEEDMKDLGNLCCGLCVLPWDREPSFEESDEYIDTWQESVGQTVITTQPRSSRCRRPSPLKRGEFILPRLSDDSVEDLLADNMARVSTMTAVLCSIARDINYELGLQTEQCRRIFDKAESVDARVSLAKARTQKLLEADND